MDKSKDFSPHERNRAAGMSLWFQLFKPNVFFHWTSDDTPSKYEIFGIERLEEHACSLAVAQTVTQTATTNRNLLKYRLVENGIFIRKTVLSITEALQAGKHLTPAAQWLTDNYALIDLQIRETSLDLSAGYYSRLPKLANGPFQGLPRVFGVAWALIAHTDSHLLQDTLSRYLLAYQSVTPLTIGELWAVPITLRIVLIENLRRTAHAIIKDNDSRHAADLLANELDNARKGKDASIQKILAQVQPENLTPAFVARLVHRFRGLDLEKDPALVWLEQRLTDKKSSIECAVRDDLQTQAAHNATIGNIITSLSV